MRMYSLLPWVNQFVYVNGLHNLLSSKPLHSLAKVWGPRGLMDKASDFESEDCGFESRRGHFSKQ